MSTVTLRRWGGAVAVSLPKKVLSTLELDAGAQVELKIEDGSIILTPARRRFTLAQLVKEQRALERTSGKKMTDREWTGSSPRGKELL